MLYYSHYPACFFTYKGKKKLEQVSVCMDPDVAAV